MSNDEGMTKPEIGIAELIDVSSFGRRFFFLGWSFVIRHFAAAR
jgi:hypothetical protein